ncbi:MAG: NADH-quinone oxidoreductase subunit N [Acidobacteria bacterium]|nr:NADH-quinone oxidoreductase subunit N [Acidobacteriota bacterium]
MENLMGFTSTAEVLRYLRQNSAAIGPEIILTIWAVGVLIVDLVNPLNKRFWLGLFSLLGIGFAGFNLYRLHGIEGTAFSQMVVLDPFAWFFKVIFLVAAALVVLISLKYLDIEEAQHGEYYALILFATIGMMFLASGIDLIMIFVGLELMAICEYVLTGYLKFRPRSAEAAMKFFLLGAFSTGILLYGMSLLYGLSGTTSLQGISDALSGVSSNQPALLLATILLVAGLGFKVAAVPFHMWAPDTFEGAPTTITAFISVGPKVAGIAVLLRIFVQSMETVRSDYTVLVALIAILTMVWGNVAAVTQNNVKRLLAYSSISHIGYVLVGVVAGPESNGVFAASYYLFAYAFMNLGTFAIVVLMRRQEIQGEEVNDFNGLFFKSPGVALLMLIFLAALAGIPPTAGFVAKFFIFSAVIDAYFRTTDSLMAVLAVIAGLTTIIALFYYWRIVKAMFLTEATDQVQTRLTPAMTAALVVTLVFTILVGIYPGPFVELARAAAAPLQ